VLTSNGKKGKGKEKGLRKREGKKGREIGGGGG